MSLVMSDPINIENEKGGKDSEPNLQQVLKLEFVKLHEDYRTLENKRHGFAQQDGSLRKRTNKLLPLLEKDRKELKHELHNANCRSHRKKSENLAQNMKDAVKIYDMYQDAIKKKIKQILEIEHHVDKITNKVIQQKFKMLALHGLSKTMVQRERDLAKAEDKLYYYTCACNLQIHENKSVREEIMDLLLGRAEFFKTHNFLKRQISQAKNKMLKIVQLAIRTYDTRDEAMSKVKALREREIKEVKQHGMDIQEFERTLHHDKKFLTFIKTKLKHRSVFEGAFERRMRLGAARERELDTILRRYRRSFKRILAYSNTKSIMDLVEAYKDLDCDNFNEFKYLTNLNSECEALLDAIDVLKGKIESAHAQVDERERAQKGTQESLQLSIIAQQELLTAMEKQKITNQARLRDVTEGIAACFNLAKCDKSPIIRLLGNKQGLTLNNIRLCIEQLDFKVSEMKVERDKLLAVKNNDGNMATFKGAVLNKSKQNHGGPFFPKVMIGGIFNADSMEDDDTKIMEKEPYYYADMKEYVYYKMIEDKIIDPLQHSVSTVNLPSGDPGLHRRESEDHMNRLMQKIESAHPREHRKHNSSSGDEIEDERFHHGVSFSQQDDSKYMHQESKSMINSGKQLKNVIPPDHNHPYPQDYKKTELGDPLLEHEPRRMSIEVQTTGQEQPRKSRGSQDGQKQTTPIVEISEAENIQTARLSYGKSPPKTENGEPTDGSYRRKSEGKRSPPLDLRPPDNQRDSLPKGKK